MLLVRSFLIQMMVIIELFASKCTDVFDNTMYLIFLFLRQKQRKLYKNNILLLLKYKIIFFKETSLFSSIILYLVSKQNNFFIHLLCYIILNNVFVRTYIFRNQLKKL